MPIYKKAKIIKVKPIHAKSWAYFTDAYGEDDCNSIEDGNFKLLDLSLL